MIDTLRHHLRRRAFEAKVRFAVRMSNLQVDNIFRNGREASFARTGALAGGVMTILMAFTVISYAVTPPFGGAKGSLMTAPQPVPAVSLAPPSPETPVDDESVIMKTLPNLSELPAPEKSLPKPDVQSIYTLLVDKTRRELFVLEETQENYKVVTSYPVSLGAEAGDKLERGDLRTPEGLYKVTGVKEQPEIPFQKYGPRAFVLNYPNTLDARLGKTGYGIWIHGSGMGDKTKPTEGCVQLNDSHIIEISRYITNGAPVYIFPGGFEAPVKNGAIQKKVIDPDTLYAIKEWKNKAMAAADKERQGG
ncbi:MAG: L,D-transpeptidase family protein [Nitrospinae bacterium]|nr:L,D-transpeptidase family protein [Nitrospinota bacterium]